LGHVSKGGGIQNPKKGTFTVPETTSGVEKRTVTGVAKREGHRGLITLGYDGSQKKTRGNLLPGPLEYKRKLAGAGNPKC